MLRIAQAGGTNSWVPAQVRKMFEEVCGADFAQSERASLVIGNIEMLAFKQGTIGSAIEFDVFEEFVRRTPNLLQPAFKLQLQMQTKLGRSPEPRRCSSLL